jgi:hypothetical protein
MAAPPPPPTGGGMSLYANLLAPAGDSSATISREPVSFKPAGAATDDKKLSDAGMVHFARTKPDEDLWTGTD